MEKNHIFTFQKSAIDLRNHDTFTLFLVYFNDKHHQIKTNMNQLHYDILFISTERLSTSNNKDN